MRYGLIFSGQGLQHGGTLPWLSDDADTGLLQQQLGADWRLRMTDTAWAHRNAVAQPLLTGLALCAWQQIGTGLPAPTAVAGYSVGELAAFCVGGIFDADTAMELARQRATAMDAAAAQLATGMLGVSNMAPADSAALCAEFDLVLAIRASASTVVLGGLREKLPLAAAKASAQGAHVTPLPIALASHTPWMQSAATAFAQVLRDRTLHRPTITVISNASGARVADAEMARQLLAHQIAQPLRWDACMETMAERGVRCVLEIGAGSALTRLWNAQFSATPARAADEFRSARAVREWLVHHAC